MTKNRSDVIPGIKPKRQTEEAGLPAVRSESFDLTMGEAVSLDPALVAAFDKTDYEGYETPRESLPIVSLRQKPLVDAGGRTVENAGGFKIYDAVSKGADTHIADTSGEKGLLLTFLMDQSTRTYWQNLTDAKPACKSFDGMNGQGTPGGVCARCPYSQFTGDERPKCSLEMNCLVWDHNLGASYVLRLGRSGIRPYSNFKTLVRRTDAGASIPLHALKIRVLAGYEKEPAPHFVPRFSIEGQVTIELFNQFRNLRSELRPVMQATTIIDTEDQEHPNGNAQRSNSELPSGVTPISQRDDEPTDTPF